eukprot:TRINITY_DN26037_c0_g1_i1.p1 TRINITY_DN26037_c0_g1~~TRINITY_DN26037_c0_g1_i1.p1  ORF type:complete len:683 (-),score=114.46 TRINITY_DN26037_c0_g1_i1:78-2126(-)
MAATAAAELPLQGGRANSSECQALPEVESPEGFDATLWVIFSLYLLLVSGIVAFTGIREYLKKRQNVTKDISDHYLAGRNIGPVTLGLSMCASTFSGYTTVGIPAEAFRKGFYALRWVGACSLMSIAFAIYAPRLHYLSLRRNYRSIMEYIWDRYSIQDPRKDPLHWLLVLGMLIPCSAYLVAQFDAFGSTMMTLSGGTVSRLHAMIGMMLIIVVFESVGGLKAVALTDVVQGGILVVGALSVPLFIDNVFGGLAKISPCVGSFKPDNVQVLSGEDQLAWLDFLVPIAFGRVMFPDLMTRSMAANSQGTLKASTIVMVVSPFVIMIPSVLLGIVGSAYHAELYAGGTKASNDVFASVVLDIVGSGTIGSLVGSVMMAATIAAIMSTADSILIAVSHMIVLDIVTPFRVKDVHASRRPKPESDSSQGSEGEEQDKKLVTYARVITFLAAAACIPIAEIGLDLSFLASIQMALMAQVFPTFVIALYTRRVTYAGAFSGLLVGMVSITLLVGVYKVRGGALAGCGVNLLVTAMVSALTYRANKAPVVEESEPLLDLIMWQTPRAERDGKVDTTKRADEAEENDDLSFDTVGPQHGPCSKEPVYSTWHLLLTGMVFALLGIPFYEDPNSEVRFLHGWPIWTLQTMGCWTAMALFVITALLRGWSNGAPRTELHDCDSEEVSSSDTE